MNELLNNFNKEYNFVILYDKAVRKMRNALNASIYTRDNKKAMFYKYQLNCYISHLKNRYNTLLETYEKFERVPNEVIHKMMKVTYLDMVGDYCL